MTENEIENEPIFESIGYKHLSDSESDFSEITVECDGDGDGDSDYIDTDDTCTSSEDDGVMRGLDNRKITGRPLKKKVYSNVLSFDNEFLSE